MKALVIGGSGIIGTGIVEAACRAGYEVSAVSRYIHPLPCNDNKVRWIQLDWYNQDEAVKLAEERFDVVVDGLVFTSEQLIRDLEIWKGGV